jgi:drug/metabolite transporter (DMT)-like permease
MRGAIALTISGLMMSTLSIFVRNIQVDAFSMTFFRFSTALVFILAYMFITGQKPEIRDKLILLLAFFNLSTVVCYIGAIQMIEVATAALLLYMAPVYVLPVAWLVGERIERETWIAVPLGITGLYMMLTPYAEINIGLIAGLLAGLSYAAVIILIKKVSVKQTPVEITFFNLLLGSIALLPWIAMTNSTNQISLGEIPWIFGLGIIPTAIPFILFAYGVKYVKVQIAPVFALVEPLAASIIGLLVFGESLSILQIAGGALILSSISIAWRARG